MTSNYDIAAPYSTPYLSGAGGFMPPTTGPSLLTFNGNAFLSPSTMRFNDDNVSSNGYGKLSSNISAGLKSEYSGTPIPLDAYKKLFKFSSCLNGCVPVFIDFIVSGLSLFIRWQSV